MPEVHRLWRASGEPEPQHLHHLAWSRFRRQHQAVAKRCRIARRRAQMPQASHEAISPILLQEVPELTAERWEQIRPLLPRPPRRGGSQDLEGRLTVEGILWVMQTGSTWREIPERFGPWTTVVHRYSRWCKEGRWARIFQILQGQEIPLFSSA